MHLEALERRLHELIPAGGRLDYDEVGQVVALAAHLVRVRDRVRVRVRVKVRVSVSVSVTVRVRVSVKVRVRAGAPRYISPASPLYLPISPLYLRCLERARAGGSAVDEPAYERGRG